MNFKSCVVLDPVVGFKDAVGNGIEIDGYSISKYSVDSVIIEGENLIGKFTILTTPQQASSAAQAALYMLYNHGGPMLANELRARIKQLTGKCVSTNGLKKFGRVKTYKYNGEPQQKVFGVRRARVSMEITKHGIDYVESQFADITGHIFYDPYYGYMKFMARYKNILFDLRMAGEKTNAKDVIHIDNLYVKDIKEDSISIKFAMDGVLQETDIKFNAKPILEFMKHVNPWI